MAAQPEHRPPAGAARLVLLFFAPVWVVPFLLVQAIVLCADGLLELIGEMLGRRLTLPDPLIWLIGIPALAVFPALVGLRGLLALVEGLGGKILGGGQGRGRSRLSRLLVGLPAALTLPIWLPLVLAFWLLKWVLWRLLVPEFAAALRSNARTADTRFVTFIGLRYLFGRRETALHSATNYFAAAGIALGVCALIVVLAVMTGFDREVKERLFGTNAHVTLLRFGQTGLGQPDSLATVLATHPEVLAVAPVVYGKAMLSAGNAAEGAIVKGIRWEDEIAVTAFDRYYRSIAGSPPRLPRGPEELPGVVLGQYVAENMGLYPGDELLLVSPAEARRTPLGFVPRMRRFRLEGIFESGMYEIDATMAFIDLAEAQSFFDLGERVTGLEMRIRDMQAAPRVSEEILGRVGGFPYTSNTWIELNQNLFTWMRTEKQVMFVILIMIILVAGFSIASSLVMLVTDKRREIGILKSMGAPAMGILRIFVLEGWVMAFSGTAVGAAVGLTLCHLLDRHQFIKLPDDVYFIDTLPVKVVWTDVGWVVVSVLLIAALSTLYPAWKASRVDPIDAIRSE